MNEMKNLLITGLTIGLVLSLGFMGYVYKTKDITPKNIPSSKPMEIHDISFDNLPPSIQDQYISKTTHYEEINRIEQKINSVSGDTQTYQADSKIVSSTTNDYKASNIADKNLAKLSMKIDKSKFKTYTCTSFEKGSIVVPKSCEKELYKFLDRYQASAKEFELIGLVDRTEFKLIRKLEDVYGLAEVKEVKKYVQIGLSRQRVIETTWLANEYLKNSAIINPVNYAVYSKNKRGFVIRAYY